MNQRTSRTIIIGTTLVTALIHLVLLNIFIGKIDILFSLNGIGFLTFLGLFLLQPAFIQNRRPLFYAAYLAFTGVTILAWFILGDLSDPLGILTKIDEALLFLALIFQWRAQS